MKEVFAEMDRDRSGTIDKREFEKAMSVLRVELSRSDLELLFERVDPNHNGLDYKEFIDMVGFRTSPKSSRSISIRP
jgi:Ca2+-binding EF-hand superfamily protein